MAYATVATLRGFMGKDATDDDAYLTKLLAAAERNINRFCNRPDGFLAGTAAAREFSGAGRSWLRIDECASVTTVETKEAVSALAADYVEWEATDWVAARGDPKRPVFGRTPYTLILCLASGDYATFLNGSYGERALPTVRVTAQWGYAATVPVDIETATCMQAVRWYKRLQSGMSDTLGSTELGTMMYTQSLDPDIRRLLKDGRYVRQVI